MTWALLPRLPLTIGSLQLKVAAPIMRAPRSKPRKTQLFRYCGGQTVGVPPNGSFQGVAWRREAPLGPGDQLPGIPDPPVQPEDPLK